MMAKVTIVCAGDVLVHSGELLGWDCDELVYDFSFEDKFICIPFNQVRRVIVTKE